MTNNDDLAMRLKKEITLANMLGIHPALSTITADEISSLLAERDADKAENAQLHQRVAELEAHVDSTADFETEIVFALVGSGHMEPDVTVTQDALLQIMRWALEARTASFGDWAIDHSAGRPILTYKNCSVIEAEDAEFVLSLIARHQRMKELETRTVSVPAIYDLVGDYDGNCCLNDAKMVASSEGIYVLITDLANAGINLEVGE